MTTTSATTAKRDRPATTSPSWTPAARPGEAPVGSADDAADGGHAARRDRAAGRAVRVRDAAPQEAAPRAPSSWPRRGRAVRCWRRCGRARGHRRGRRVRAGVVGRSPRRSGGGGVRPADHVTLVRRPDRGVASWSRGIWWAAGTREWRLPRRRSSGRRGRSGRPAHRDGVEARRAVRHGVDAFLVLVLSVVVAWSGRVGAGDRGDAVRVRRRRGRHRGCAENCRRASRARPSQCCRAWR